MTGLMIGPAQRAAIDELIAVAQANPYDVRRLIGLTASETEAFRDLMQTMAVDLPVGFHVAYTQEIQPNAPPPGLCHHISISVDGTGRGPSEAAVEMILAAFRMPPLAHANVWVEDVGPGCQRAVNVVAVVQEGSS